MKKRASIIVWALGTAWFLFLTVQFYHYRGRTKEEVSLLLLLTVLLIVCYELYRRVRKHIPTDEMLTRPFHISVLIYVGVVWAAALFAVLFMITVTYPPGEPPLWIAYGGAVRSISGIIGGWALFAMCWYVIGRSLLRCAGLDSALTGLEKTLYATGLGVVACGLYFYVVALMRVVGIGALIIFFVVSVLCGVFFWKDLWKGLCSRFIRVGVGTSEPETNILTALMALVIFIVLVIFLNNGGYYLFRGDEMRTYINLPATYIEQGGVVAFPYDLHNNGSNAFAFIYIPLLLTREDLPNFASLFFYLATVGIAGLIAYQLTNKRTALWAMFFTATIPWSFAFLVGSKVDFMVTFIALAGIAALLQAWKTERTSSLLGLLVVSGFLVGFSGMIKYSALLLAPVAVALAFLWSPAKTFSERVMQTCFYGLCIGAIVLPWTMMNFIETGNPTYPYGSYRAGYFQELSPVQLSLYESFYDYKVSVRQVFSTQNPWWKNIWILITNQSAYPGNIPGVLFFGLLPGLLLAGALFKKKRREWTAIAAVILSLFLAWLFIITLQLWYVMLIFPLWCLLYAPLVADKFPRWARVFLVGIVLVVFIERVSSIHLFLIQYYSGTLTKQEYNELLGESNRIATYLNDSLLPSNPDYLIFPITTKGFELLIKDNYKHYFNYAFDPASYRVINTWILFAIKYDTNDALVAAMRTNGITHILYDQQDIDAFRPVWCYEGEHSEMCLLYNRLTGRFQNIIPYLTVVHETPEWTIYGI